MSGKLLAVHFHEAFESPSPLLLSYPLKSHGQTFVFIKERHECIFGTMKPLYTLTWRFWELWEMPGTWGPRGVIAVRASHQNFNCPMKVPRRRGSISAKFKLRWMRSMYDACQWLRDRLTK